MDRIVVTGGAGFVGSHLTERLVADGGRVLVVDDLSTGRADVVPGEARLERLDVAREASAAVIVRFRPTVVYHLAAQASVPRSMEAPLRDLEVNVVGSHHVARAARDAGARIVFVSSGGAIYGECARSATESTRPAPASFYGVHKLAAERHVAGSGASYAIARPSNIYGFRQAGGLEGAVVAAFLAQADSADALTIDGDGRQTRDFIHVSDVVTALQLLGRASSGEGIWNVSAGRSVTILELARVVERVVGRNLGRRASPPRPGDVRHSSIRSIRLTASGWAPTMPLERGVALLAG